MRKDVNRPGTAETTGAPTPSDQRSEEVFHATSLDPSEATTAHQLDTPLTTQALSESLSSTEAWQAFGKDAAEQAEPVLATATRMAEIRTRTPEFASNPFSSESQTFIEQQSELPWSNISRRAIALGEPLARQEEPLTSEALHTSRLKSAQALGRLIQSLDENPDIFAESQNNCERLYDQLFQTTFQQDTHTSPEEIIPEHVRELKLFITNLVDSYREHAALMEQLVEDPKSRFEQLTDKQFSGAVELSAKPPAVVLTLEKADFDLFTRHYPDKITTPLAFTLISTDLPPVANGRLLITCKAEAQTPEEVAKRESFIDHEWRHAIGRIALAARGMREGKMAEVARSGGVNKFSFSEHREHATEIGLVFSDLAKEEIIAYATQESYHPSMEQMGSAHWRANQERVALNIDDQPYSPAEKAAAYKLYSDQYGEYLQKVARYAFAASKLLTQGDEAGHTLDPYSKEALLWLTPADEAEQLAPFLGDGTDSVEELFARERQQVADQLTGFVEALPSGDQINVISDWNEILPEDFLETINRYLPPQAVGSLNALTEVKEPALKYMATAALVRTFESMPPAVHSEIKTLLSTMRIMTADYLDDVTQPSDKQGVLWKPGGMSIARDALHKDVTRFQSTDEVLRYKFPDFETLTPFSVAKMRLLNACLQDSPEEILEQLKRLRYIDEVHWCDTTRNLALKQHTPEQACKTAALLVTHDLDGSGLNSALQCVGGTLLGTDVPSIQSCRELRSIVDGILTRSGIEVTAETTTEELQERLSAENAIGEDKSISQAVALRAMIDLYEPLTEWIDGDPDSPPT